MATVAPVWDGFLSTYPETELELHVGDAPIDLVAEGVDAGIGPQDRAAEGMIAVRVTGPMKMAVVGAPAYFAQWRAPRDPDELVHHSCVQLRLSPRSAAFALPFVRDGRTLRISVDGRVAVTDANLARRSALDRLAIPLTFQA